jgi:hypothetical protein
MMWIKATIREEGWWTTSADASAYRWSRWWSGISLLLRHLRWKPNLSHARRRRGEGGREEDGKKKCHAPPPRDTTLVKETTVMEGKGRWTERCRMCLKVCANVCEKRCGSGGGDAPFSGSCLLLSRQKIENINFSAEEL